MIVPIDIKNSYEVIKPYIKNTPIISSCKLNNEVGHNILLKAEHLQFTNSFKVRGVLNALLHYKKRSTSPKKIVAYSSGNHAIAIASCMKFFKFECEIYMSDDSSKSKKEHIKSLGAHLIITKTRKEAEQQAALAARQDSSILLLHPSDNDLVITGAGTLCYESLLEIGEKNIPNAIFVPCGGGALVSGTFLATKLFNKTIKVFAAEPSMANDTSLSFRSGKIIKLNNTPSTIADGARTLCLSSRTFQYIKLIDDVIEINESEIITWTNYLQNSLGIKCETTSALAMAAAYKWSKRQKTKQNILILLSGGNIDKKEEGLTEMFQSIALK